MAEDGRIERYVGALLLLLLAIGCLAILRPFLSALLWAIVLSFSTWPIYARIERMLGGRRSLAAALMVALAAAFLLLPMLALGSKLADEVPEVASVVSRWMENGLPPPPAWLATSPVVGVRIAEYWQSVAQDTAKLASDLRAYVGPASQWILSVAGGLGSGIADLVISLAISFFLYRDGLAWLRALSSALARVGGRRAEHLMVVAGTTIKGVVYGVLGTNLVEALLAALGFHLAGVPGAFFLAFASFFLTIIPFAVTLIFIPAILWLLHEGATTGALFLVGWYILVFTILDGALRAYFISRRSHLPLILVFLGIFGGIFAFGLLGIFVGPTLLAVGFAFLQEWNAPEAVHRVAIHDEAPVPIGRGRLDRVED